MVQHNPSTEDIIVNANQVGQFGVQDHAHPLLSDCHILILKKTHQSHQTMHDESSAV
jgi:hypothetical protein